MNRLKLQDLISKSIIGVWGDEASEIGTYVIRTTNFTNTGNVDYTNVVKREINEKVLDEKQLLDGDIIIEKSGGGPNTPVGRVVQFKQFDDAQYVTNNFTAILRPNKEIVDPNYLFYQLFYFYQIGRVRKYQNQTTGIYNLKLYRYLNEDVFLPDRTAQSKTVVQLDKLRTLIAHRQESISHIDKYFKSVFLEMFLENPTSKNWEIDSIENAQLILTSVYGTAKKANSEGNGIPVLRMNNLSTSGDISLKDIKWVELNGEEAEKLKLKNRTILFNRTNSPELVGKISVWDKGKGYTFAGYLINLVLDEKKVNPYYFASYFNSDFGKKVLQSKAKPSGTLANISATTLKTQKILLPPISKQNEFEILFLKVRKFRENLKTSLTLLEDLFVVILFNTFREGTIISEEEVFENIISTLKIDDFKQGKRLEYLINWLKKSGQKFSDLDKYDIGYTRLMELMEVGSIEQIFENGEIKLKVKK